MDVMYNSNCLKSLLLSISTTNECLSKEGNTIYCIKSFFLGQDEKLPHLS